MISPQSASVDVWLISRIGFYRDALARALATTRHVVVLGTDGAALAALPQILARQPDVILLDVGVDDRGAFLRALRQSGTPIPIVGLGPTASQVDIVALMESGIGAYVDSDSTVEDLVRVVQMASRGEVVCSPQITGAVVRRIAALASAAGAQGKQPPLTRREHEQPGSARPPRPGSAGNALRFSLV
jgi:DNA-binding NarL/FixJ family response regulator